MNRNKFLTVGNACLILFEMDPGLIEQYLLVEPQIQNLLMPKSEYWWE